jgi:hypothetical protein
MGVLGIIRPRMPVVEDSLVLAELDDAVLVLTRRGGVSYLGKPFEPESLRQKSSERAQRWT